MCRSLKNTDMDSRVDLHIHTTASDGTWEPEELVREVIDKEIKIFAVSDHDTTQNVRRTIDITEGTGIDVIPAVEINSSYNGHNYHILGYGLDIYNAALQKIIERNRRLLEEKDYESIRYLENSCKTGLLSGYRSYENNPKRGGWKALNYAIDSGLCKNHKEFFKLFGGWDNPFETVDYSSAGEVIKTIKSAGGIAVLAHPGASFYGSDHKGVVSFMISQGIDGVECFHPENNDEVTQYCIDTCFENNLYITGGSDCHGTFVSTRCLGKPEIYLRQLKLPDKWQSY